MIGVPFNIVIHISANEIIYFIKIVLMNGDTAEFCIAVVKNFKFTVRHTLSGVKNLHKLTSEAIIQQL